MDLMLTDSMETRDRSLPRKMKIKTSRKVHGFDITEALSSILALVRLLAQK